MEDRDNKGRFVKGNRISKGNNGANVGRKRTLKTQIKDALALAEDAMPDIIGVMVERAQNPDDKDCQRAAEYLMDRIYGKPNVGISARLEEAQITVIEKIKDYGST